MDTTIDTTDSIPHEMAVGFCVAAATVCGMFAGLLAINAVAEKIDARREAKTKKNAKK